MNSEWNILQILHRLMNQMKERLTLKLVVSHQDDYPTIDIKTLSTKTQLNIKADKLITKGLNRLKSKQFGWSNTVYGKIDWEIFTPVNRGNKNKHFK